MVVNDSGIGIHLVGVSAETLKDLVRGQALGGFLEAFIAGELLRQRTWSAHSWSLSHYRSPDGREVDLIIELADGVVIALEVKAASTVRRQDFRHLEWLRENWGIGLLPGLW